MTNSKLNNQPLCVLFADDDIDDRIFFENALKEIPIRSRLITVNNGEQLMEYLKYHEADLPDVLFLDLSMPRKTGFECLVEIKENEKLKNLPVIMFTTSFTRGIELEYNLINTLSKIGAQDYLRKPGDYEEYKLVIHQALTRMMEKSNYAENENNL